MSPTTETSYLTVEEFEQMEKLLGRLLMGATDRETDLLLHIHARLTKILETQETQQSIRDRLINLAS